MPESQTRNIRADLVAAGVLVLAMLVAAWPPSAGILVSVEAMLAGLAGSSGELPPRPAWVWPTEALLIIALGMGVMLWGRHQPPLTTLALAGAAALGLLGLDVIIKALQLASLQLVAPAITALSAAGLCVALGERKSPATGGGAAPQAGEAAMAHAAAGAMAEPPRAPNRSRGPTPLVQARAALKQGRLEQAWEHLRRVPATTESLETLYALGVEFQRTGQAAESRAVYERILQQDAEFRDVGARLQALERRGARTADTPAGRVDNGTRKMPARGAAPERPRDPPDLKPVGNTSGKAREPVRLVEGQIVTLGRYEIVRELGRGAMGVVYLGRDPKINRVVAIKAIPLAEEFEAEDLDEAKARFFREAETAGRLNHPNIVTIYDVGEEHDLAYIAMEFLEGEHLSGHVKPQHLLPMPVVVDLIARVADALGYAHRENVVHRDIKPANLMYDRAGDTLKITDFGIARLTDSSRTRTGIVLGTPSFMSPEQLEGKPVTGQSDLFSLGVTLYQLLTGQLPFRGSSMPKLMFAIANLAHAPVTQVRPELPEGLNQIIDMALAKNPADRFPTGAHMAQALRAFHARLGT